MATERYIHGKQDNSNHDGRYASVRHLAETDAEVIEFWEEVWPELKNYVLYGDAGMDQITKHDAATGVQLASSPQPLDKSDKKV